MATDPNVREVIRKIIDFRGSLDGPSVDQLAGRWLVRYTTTVPGIIKSNVTLLERDTKRKARIEALIADLEEARTQKVTFTVKAVQERLRAIIEEE